MKQRIYLLVAFLLMLSLTSMSQTFLKNQVQPYFGQKGIKKKISELQAVKVIVRQSPDSTILLRLTNRIKTLPDLIKNRKANVENLNDKDIEEGEEQQVLRSAVTSEATTVTQKDWSNFLSTYLENSMASSPDPSGAVGSSQVIVVTNKDVKVFDKPSVTDAPLVTPKGYSNRTAASTFSVTLDQFFSPLLSPDSYAAHPNIRYDRLSKRWFIMANEVNPSHENNLILIAVSDGEKVTESSGFIYYSFNSSLFPYNHGAPYAPFLDLPSLGVDKHSVLIGGSQYGFDSVTFAGYVINKNKLLHGELVVYPFELGSLVYATRTVTGLYLPIAVYNDDPAAKKSFFIGLDFNEYTLDIAGVEYDKYNKPLRTYQKNVTIPNYNFTRDMSSPGGLAPVYNLPINERRIRFLNASIFKNKLTGTSSLWTAHAVGVNQSGMFIPVGPPSTPADFISQARNASRWYKIGNIYSSPGIFQKGTVYDSEEPSGRRAVQYFNPSIAASGQGHLVISGTTCAYNEYLNVFAAGRYFGDQLGKTKAPVKLTNSNAIYAPFSVDFATRTRIYNTNTWGDYSQSVVDPLDDQTIWTFQEYADIDDSYGVRAVQFKAPPPATPEEIGSLSNKSDTILTLKAESVNNSGFFDPGKDEGGPGYNRLSTKSTGSIIASNIKFISPTKISFKLNTKSKLAGHYLLIITNPDGQFVVADYTINADGNSSNSSVSSKQGSRSNKMAQNFITGSALYPNPTADKVTLKVTAAKEHIAKIVLIDINGKQVFEKNYNFSKGDNETVLPIQKLVKGTYIAVVHTSDNVITATQKFVKQ